MVKALAILPLLVTAKKRLASGALWGCLWTRGLFLAASGCKGTSRFKFVWGVEWSGRDVDNYFPTFLLIKKPLVLRFAKRTSMRRGLVWGVDCASSPLQQINTYPPQWVESSHKVRLYSWMFIKVLLLLLL